MKICKCKEKLRLNLQKDIEELQIRLKLKEDKNFALEMLVAFRPGATLRQINNTRQANLYAESNRIQL